MKIVFDETNNRVVTENDEHLFYTDDFESDNKVLINVVNMFNNDKTLIEIDDYLLSEELCTQDDRELIIESLFHLF